MNMLKPLLKRIIQYSSTLSRCSFVNKVATIVLCFNKNVFGAQLKMDRFLIKKRKVGSIDEGDEGESSEATVSEKRAVTNTQQKMLNKKNTGNQIENFMKNGKICILLRNTIVELCVSYVDKILRNSKNTHSIVILKLPTVQLMRSFQHRQNNEPMKYHD